MKTFDHKKIEKKWQKKWKENKIYETKDEVKGKKNKYVLVEFPYPSGNLHVGHWYAFAVPDIYVRHARMKGENVLYPIGFDSFGLPAENAAIKHGLNPEKWTYDNIEHMTKQLASMGNSFDWTRKVIASDPEYYKWTQWLFLQFYKNNLAYKKKSTVPWCDKCKTVLANEQIISGECERCGTEVIQKELDQWFFKTTKYAERLLEDLEELDWPSEIKDAQREWIGKSEGSLLTFSVMGTDDKIKVFTTRADTLFGVTYVVLAPEHKLLEKWKNKIENWSEVEKYIKETSVKKELERKEAKEKTGIELKGIMAINPATKEEIPVWIADYVLASYGTGAVMAVPAHDERDFEFAKKFGLDVKDVIVGENVETPYTGYGKLINSGDFNDLTSKDAIKKITEHVGGEMTTQYRLRDWLLSRQRYWGCPIPIVYDPNGNPHEVPEEHLPWTLPEDVDFTPTGEAPLAKSKELKERVKNIFGEGWTPEVDTMDTFVDSSWYFLRYIDPKNEKEFSSKEKQKLWMPVDMYSGGAEHTTMHLLYSRFFHKALFDMNLVLDKEPYKKRMNRGLILGPDGAKMSKSKGNVINPDEHVERVGADTVKTYLAFIGPYGEVGQYPWDLGGIAGVRRFLERVWHLAEKIDEKTEVSEELSLLLHQTIKKVGNDIEAYKFNTAISQMMILLNRLEKEERISNDIYETLLKLLAPFAPHLTEELWEKTGHENSIHLEKWPDFDESILKKAKVVIVVQVNGKVRDKFEVEAGLSEEDLTQKAKTLENVKRNIAGGEIVKEVVVPDKLVNFVVKT
jgi:leucyl-tRNA synthetase